MYSVLFNLIHPSHGKTKFHTEGLLRSDDMNVKRYKAVSCSTASTVRAVHMMALFVKKGASGKLIKW
jgi:hypothetical protein